MLKWWDRIPKKLIVLALGAVVQIIPGLSDDTKQHIMVIATGFLVGQGIADHGKEAAKVAVQAGGKPVTAAPVTITPVKAPT